jgi:hypothetical protein
VLSPFVFKAGISQYPLEKNRYFSYEMLYILGASTCPPSGQRLSHSRSTPSRNELLNNRKRCQVSRKTHAELIFKIIQEKFSKVLLNVSRKAAQGFPFGLTITSVKKFHKLWVFRSTEENSSSHHPTPPSPKNRLIIAASEVTEHYQLSGSQSRQKRTFRRK